jgi:hypothetical protein
MMHETVARAGNEVADATPASRQTSGAAGIVLLRDFGGHDLAEGDDRENGDEEAVLIENAI